MGLLGSLGSLNVLLSADTAQFSSAMDKAAYTAERELQRISRSAKLNSAVLTTALIAAATAFTVKMKNIIESADQIGKMAQSIGMTTEQLSKLKYAAELSDISIEDLRTSFSKLNKNSFENISTFKALGVSVEDSVTKKARSSYDILLDLADAFSRMPDGVGKTTAAINIFGRSGASMIPLLNQGKDGIQAMGAEAERLGIVIDTKTSKSAEFFNDNMKTLAKSIDGIFFSIGSSLIPVLAGLTENMNKTGAATGTLAAAGKGLAVVLVSVINAGSILFQTLNSITKQVADTFAVIYVAAHGKFKEALEMMAQSSKETNDQWTQTAANVQKNWDLLSENVSGNIKKTTDSMTGPIREFTAEQLKVIEESKRRWDSMANGIGNAFGSAFEKAILEGKKFRDVMIGLLKDIEAAIFKSLVSQQIADAISSGISSAFKSPSPGGTKTVTVKSSKYGNVFSNGDIVPFATGGIIGGPVMFPMAGGKAGLAGEAGKEAILPLTRTPSGDLGVKTTGANKTIVNIYAPPGSDVKQDSQQEGGIEKINIYIDKAVAGNIGAPGSDTHRALKNTFGLGQLLTKR